jgi:hypothetical protein
MPIGAGNTVTFPRVWMGQYTITINLPGYAEYRNSNVVIAANNVSYGAFLAQHTVLFSEGFNGAFPNDGWTKIDQDGDDREDWSRVSTHGGHSPIESNGMILSRSWVPGMPVGFDADNWLVTPAIELPGHGGLLANFNIVGNDADGGIYLDHMEILVSTTGISTGTPIGTLAPIGTPGTVIGDFRSVARIRTTGQWTFHSLDLSQYADAGHIHLAIRHRDTDRGYVLVNDIELVQGAPFTTGAVVGTVINAATGQPKVGIRVEVTGTNIFATTNQNGMYFITGIPEGNVTVTARSDGFGTYVSGDIAVVAGRVYTYNVSMFPPSGAITGIVTFEGAAVQGAIVTVYPHGLQTNTNAQGRFTINHIPVGTISASAAYGDTYDKRDALVIVDGQTLEVNFNLSVSDADIVGLPLVTALGVNFPNPFNPTTTIRFDMAQAGHVVIDVFNIRGQRVTTLVNEEFGAGFHRVEWNGTDDRGRTVGSGVYFYNMRTGDFNTTRRMLLMK